MIWTDGFCFAVEQFRAVVDMTVDVPGSTVNVGRVALTAVAGTVRLHTNREV